MFKKYYYLSTTLLIIKYCESKLPNVKVFCREKIILGKALSPTTEFARIEKLAHERIAWADEAMPGGKSYAQDLAEVLGLDPETMVAPGPTKELNKILVKTFSVCNGQIDKVHDIGRIRIFFEDIQSIRDLRDFVSDEEDFDRFNEDRGISIISKNDYYLNPHKHGYVGYHLIICVDLGEGRSMPLEIQFMHKDMLSTYDRTHEKYEEIKEIKEIARREGRNLTLQEETTLEKVQEENRIIYETDGFACGVHMLSRDYEEGNQTLALMVVPKEESFAAAHG